MLRDEMQRSGVLLRGDEPRGATGHGHSDRGGSEEEPSSFQSVGRLLFSLLLFCTYRVQSTSLKETTQKDENPKWIQRKVSKEETNIGRDVKESTKRRK